MGAPSTSGLLDPKKRGASKTAEKWVVENNKELHISVLLKIYIANHNHVVMLNIYAVCSQFRAKLEGMHNYCSLLIDGLTTIRTSIFKENAVTDMHAWAMSLHKKEQSNFMYDYAHMKQGLREKLQHKFEVAYFIAKEKLAFSKM